MTARESTATGAGASSATASSTTASDAGAATASSATAAAADRDVSRGNPNPNDVSRDIAEAKDEAARAHRGADGGFLVIDDVSYSYDSVDGASTQALDHIDLTIREGEFVSFIGPSGCGKTTLLRQLAGLSEPTEGAVFLDGERIEGPDPARGCVFQQGSLFPWLTVRQNVEFGLRSQGLLKKRRKDVLEYLDLVGMADFADSYPHEISGGMAQRVAIVRSLINHPRLLLLDEPMGALDAFTRQSLQDVILRLRGQFGITMVLVTHDLDEAVYMSDRIAVMTPRPGRIVGVVDVSDTLPSPRDRESTDFLAVKTEVTRLLGGAA